MADKDLGFGRIVEGLSQSPFWKQIDIFGIEDDAQDGGDHISGYRSTVYCVIPYTYWKQVVRIQYHHQRDPYHRRDLRLARDKSVRRERNTEVRLFDGHTRLHSFSIGSY